MRFGRDVDGDRTLKISTSRTILRKNRWAKWKEEKREQKREERGVGNGEMLIKG